MKTMTITGYDVRGKRCLVRVDFNVPLDDALRITDDTRITASLPTIRLLLDGGASVVLMSHLGRPKGAPNPKYSLAPVAARLRELLGKDVLFAPDCIGDEVARMAAALQPGDVLLLENLRFHAEEEANDPAFARQLAAAGDLYVNDAFGTAHRAHASTEGVTKFLAPCLAGLLMEKEISYLQQAIASPARPYTAILGGAKISGKIDVIQNLLGKVDTLLIGGGMMFTFLKAQGHAIGSSLIENDRVELARALLDQAQREGKALVLPTDVVVAPELKDDAPSTIVSVTGIPDDQMGVDIGPDTRRLFRETVLASRLVVWNGPMGVFEIPSFALGTMAVAQALADATAAGATTIVGGGDSAAAIAQAGLERQVSHVSTGGGASLEFLEGKVLPGVAALTDRA